MQSIFKGNFHRFFFANYVVVILLGEQDEGGGFFENDAILFQIIKLYHEKKNHIFKFNLK